MFNKFDLLLNNNGKVFSSKDKGYEEYKKLELRRS